MRERSRRVRRVERACGQSGGDGVVVDRSERCDRRGLAAKQPRRHGLADVDGGQGDGGIGGARGRAAGAGDGQRDCGLAEPGGWDARRLGGRDGRGLFGGVADGGCGRRSDADARLPGRITAGDGQPAVGGVRVLPRQRQCSVGESQRTGAVVGRDDGSGGPADDWWQRPDGIRGTQRRDGGRDGPDAGRGTLCLGPGERRIGWDAKMGDVGGDGWKCQSGGRAGRWLDRHGPVGAGQPARRERRGGELGIVAAGRGRGRRSVGNAECTRFGGRTVAGLRQRCVGGAGFLPSAGRVCH